MVRRDHYHITDLALAFALLAFLLLSSSGHLPGF